MSDIPDGADAGPWSDGFHAAEAIYQKDIDRLQGEVARLSTAVFSIASSPGWVNSNALAWRKCQAGNIWLSDDPTRCYHGRLVTECERSCPARIAFNAYAAMLRE